VKTSAVMLGLCGLSLFVPGVAVATVVAMALAALAGLLAGRLHAAEEVLRRRKEYATTHVSLRRKAWFCDDAAFALCVLGVLFALPIELPI